MAFNELNSVENYIIHQLSSKNLNSVRGFEESKAEYGVLNGNISHHQNLTEVLMKFFLKMF